MTLDLNSPDLTAELQHQSAAADLLLVGCEQSDNRWSIRIGGLARLMTRTAECPVMLVPERTGADRHLRPAA